MSTSKSKRAAFTKYTTPERYQHALNMKAAAIARRRERENCPDILPDVGPAPSLAEMAATFHVPHERALDVFAFKNQFQRVFPYYAKGCCWLADLTADTCTEGSAGACEVAQ